MSSAQTRFVVKDYQVIVSILNELGINDYEPQILYQLLEFNYRYTTIVLDDARMYSDYANKKDIDVDDIRVAIKMAQDTMIFKSPSREELMLASQVVNKVPLPQINSDNVLRVPHDSLLKVNYGLKTDLVDPGGNIIKANTIKTAAEILEESRKKEIEDNINEQCDEFMNNPVDFDLQQIINELNYDDGIEEYVQDELLEFQSFENQLCFDMELSSIIEQGWSP